MGAGGHNVRPEIHATAPRFARKRALAAGEIRYVSGRPCPKGHTGARFASNAQCVECAAGNTNKWHAQHPGEYRRSHPVQYAMYKARRRAAEATPAWAVPICVAAIYRIMQSLRKDGVDVNVDHIIPLQGKTVRGLHVRENLQIIPASENFRKPRIFVPT